MIYLDYSATTPTKEEVIDYFVKINKNYNANPNSNYLLGFNAKNIITETTKTISNILNIKENEIIYTSGSTESNNLAIKGIIPHNKKVHIITTNFEHSSVIAPINYLQQQGHEVDIVKTNSKGIVEIEELKKLIKKETKLISITAVNSEIGIKEPIEEISAFLKENYPNIIFHVDLTQLLTKTKIDLTNIDLASASAHKFYGLKGVGLLIKKENIKLTPLIHGGKSTTVYRSGTPATSLIASLGKALELAYNNMDKKYKQIEELNKHLKEKLSTIPNIHINSNDLCIPHIINFSIIGQNPNQIQEKLSKKEIYISTQTACSNGGTISKSVYSLTNNKEIASSSLRVSISHITTKEEINKFIETLNQILRGE